MALIQKFKPNRDKLKIVDISIDVNNLSQDQIDKKMDFISSQPQIFYDNFELPASSIKKMTLDSNSFMPTIYIQFVDLFGIMHDVGFPKDNSIIRVVIPANNPAFANIFMQFKIQKYQIELMRDATTRKIHMWGICSIDNLLIKQFSAYKDSTSFDVFSKLAQESGLGFVSNCELSSDKMNWINPGMNNSTFLKDVANKSWVGESGFVWSFVDLYYNLNYIDIEKQLSEDINNIKWIPSDFLTDNKDNENTETINPMLSNSESIRGSNAFFVGETIINQSTEISLNRGYLRNIHYYDIDGNWKEKSGAYKQYQLDTITTAGSENTTIYLKGDAGNVDFYNSNQSYIYLDKIDTKNMYPDYLWAKVQNEENIFDLQKITIQVILSIPNYNLKRFEKIKLEFINNKININENIKNTHLNGEWLVTGIIFEWNNNLLFQRVNIIKRELTPLDL